MTSRRSVLLSLLLFAAPLACDRPGAGAAGSASGAPTSGDVTLNGAGATFPYPLYSKWMSEYNHANPNIKINYQSIGSGGGIRQISARTVDFGATDAPMTADEEKAAPGKLVHIPT